KHRSQNSGRVTAARLSRAFSGVFRHSGFLVACRQRKARKTTANRSPQPPCGALNLWGMTSPRPYGGAYSSPSFADTPIYDSLVAERGTPQIAPIRVPAAYEPLEGYAQPSSQPALPALPSPAAAPQAPAP